MDVLQSRVSGLVPQFVNPKTGDLKHGILTLGARADSYYEYLLKQWLQSGRTEEKLVGVHAVPSQGREGRGREEGEGEGREGGGALVDLIEGTVERT